MRRVGGALLRGRAGAARAAVMTCAMTGLFVAIEVSPASPAPAPAPDPCVSILSPTIGAIQAGNTVFFGEIAAAPGIVSGSVIGPLAQVPGVEETSSLIFSQFPTIDAVANEFSSQGAAGLTKLNDSLAPLAAANPALNALVALGANGLSSMSSTLGTAIAPFNVTLAQLAQTLSFLSSATCG
jgi:hypothetical protein